MARRPAGDYLCGMIDDPKRALRRTRLFLIIFFGLAIVLSITTILGTWDEQKNGVIDPATMDQLTGKPSGAGGGSGGSTTP